MPAPEYAWGDALLRGFESKYGIRANVVGETIDSDQLSDRALDVYQLGADTAASHTARLAPYLVFYWLEIPAALKSSKAYWYESCGGFVAVGYDPAAVPAPAALADLARPGYQVAIPEANLFDEGLASVVAVSMSLGGSPRDAAPGVNFFQRLHGSGNLVRMIDSPAPVMIGWNYELPARYTRLAMPATVLGYRVEAINRAAPHPAAARLWEEYLFSDGAQNHCMASGARPSRFDAMRSDGVLDLAAASRLEHVPAGAVVLQPHDLAVDRLYVDAQWAAATGL